MRCNYLFPVRGTLKAKAGQLITVDNVDFEIRVSEEGFMNAIHASISVPDKSMWPRGTSNPAVGVALHLNMKSPQFAQVGDTLRTIEGLLSAYGIESIDFETMQESWVAENAEEKAELTIFGMRRRFVRHPASSRPADPIPPELLRRIFQGAAKARSAQTGLSFFRKGFADLDARRYIEAIYDFYFMLESMFGGGQTKNHRVKEIFKSSQRLRQAIERVLTRPHPWLAIDPGLPQIEWFEAKYRGKEVDATIDEIVDLRGFLHHQTTGRRDIWTPDGDWQFETEATFLYFVCEELAHEIFKEAAGLT